jgi:hypothetical protein
MYGFEPKDIRTFILQDRQEAYEAGRREGLESVIEEIEDGMRLGILFPSTVCKQIITKIINKLKD